ncbi:hypothetical protein [Polaribacter sp.]|uniref:hypothetical protein n=2 Tax=Polaribacter sp. TaxID=1920175 RepID=UPI004047A612
MKNIQQIIKIFFLLLLVACTENDLRDVSFVNDITAPANVAAVYNITQDNTGSVTITPNADGAVSFEIFFGDGTTAPAIVPQGESAFHVYAEGTYQVKIVAVNLTGVKTEATQQLIVSFKAPQNLVVVVENDAAISKQVNITANADFATFFEFNSGETGVTQPVVSGNIGSTISYTYQNAGTYDIMVEAKGGAIATTKYEVSFEVTEILAPIASAATPPFRNAVDVISIFSDAYTDVAGSDFYPNWGQATQYTPFDLNGDAILQYSNLNYQGINIGSTQDLTSMEFLRLDVWTADAADIDTYLISVGSGEKFIKSTLTKDEWTSIEIPLSAFTDQGLSVADIYQFKFVGSGTVFIDNIYFYKSPTGASPPLLSDDFEGNGNIPAFTGDAAGANVIDNPHINAGNFSKKVLEYKDTGGQYANVQFTSPNKFDLKNGQSVFSINLYVPSSSISGTQPNQVSLKLQNSDLGGNSWQTQTEIIKTIVLDQWQTVTFDFVTDNWINLNNNGVDPAPVDRTDLDKVVIQLNSENNNDTVTGYIDDFYYGLAQVQEMAPIVKDGFEGFGTISAWVGDAAGANASFANPFMNSDNNSPTVLEYTDTGGQYANVNFTVANKFNIADKSVFSIMIYVPSSSISGSQNNQVSLKLQNSDLGGNSWQTQTEIIKNIVLDQWQVITFDFVNDNWINLNNNGVDPAPINRTDLDKVVIQVNGENNNDTVTAYIDNVNYY